MLHTRSVIIDQVYVFTNGTNRIQLEASSKTEALNWFFEYSKGCNIQGYRMLYIDRQGNLKEVDLIAAQKRRL